MKTSKKIQKHFQQLLDIRYDNPHGGAYAYVQFMAYSRELLLVLRSYQGFERQMETIEGINWLFNECLTVRFTPKNKIIFEEKLRHMRSIFESVTDIQKMQAERPTRWRTLHAQAA